MKSSGFLTARLFSLSDFSEYQSSSHLYSLNNTAFWLYISYSWRRLPLAPLQSHKVVIHKRETNYTKEVLALL